MNKKEYIQPKMQVIDLAPSTILAASSGAKIDIDDDDAYEDAC